MAIGPTGIPTFFNIPQVEYNAYQAVVQQAQAAWAGMVLQFATENVCMGITQSGKTQLIAEALQQVNSYGSTGSLWLAYTALSNVQITPEMAPFLTQARLEYMRNSLIQTIAAL